MASGTLFVKDGQETVELPDGDRLPFYRHLVGDTTAIEVYHLPDGSGTLITNEAPLECYRWDNEKLFEATGVMMRGPALLIPTAEYQGEWGRQLQELWTAILPMPVEVKETHRDAKATFRDSEGNRYCGHFEVEDRRPAPIWRFQFLVNGRPNRHLTSIFGVGVKAMHQEYEAGEPPR